MRRLRTVLVVATASFLALSSRGAAQSAPKPTPENHNLPLKAPHEQGGDLDAMRKRRLIRVLVPYSKTAYFIDNGQPRGTSVDAFKLFEDYLNRKYKTGNLRIHVALVPTRRDKLAYG